MKHTDVVVGHLYESSIDVALMGKAMAIPSLSGEGEDQEVMFGAGVGEVSKRYTLNLENHKIKVIVFFFYW